jgi:hypothetical protein
MTPAERAENALDSCYAEGHVSQFGTACGDCVEIEIREARRESNNTLEGIRRFLAGEKVGVSTGIDDSLTYGYGRLDEFGFWEFPVPRWVISSRATTEEKR